MSRFASPWLVCLAFACGGEATKTEAKSIGDSGVSVLTGDGTWQIEAEGRTVLSSATDDAVVIRSVDESAEMQFGSFFFTETETAPAQPAELAVEWAPVADGVVRGTVSGGAGDGGALRPQLRLTCRPDSRFVGLGAQVDGADHRGERVPLWVAEQGNGKKEGAGRTDFPIGAVHDSYFPIPWVFDPAGGWGMLVEGASRTVMDLCAEDPKVWTVDVRASQWSFLIVTGSEPLQLIERMTAITGRQKLPNPWALGVWTDAVRGQEAVLSHARALRESGTPVSAIWSEDWAGYRENGLTGFGLTYHWAVDEALYPDLPGMIRELEGMGIAFLGYFNTFMQEDSPEWDQALADGHVITDEAGSPYTFTAPSLRTASLVDVTRPESREWMAGYMKAAADLGIRGWMADFAEWLPTDSQTHAGDGWTTHNDYPGAWASLNEEVLSEAYPDGDWVFFSRSGWTGSWTSSPVVWAGDQNTDWTALDGLPSAVALAVNMGASGVPFFASDIGGYSSLGEVEPRTKELWHRWTEMSAWSPLMRTHHGHDAAGNWQLVQSDLTISDPSTLAHFAEFATLHQALFPYLNGLAAEAEATGAPLVRGLFLHHPEFEEAYRTDQYLLGEHVLVAPIVQEGATGRSVWLPPGRWTPWPGDSEGAGERLEGPGEVEVTAPIGEIPVFLREGAVIPMFADPPDTLVGWSSEGLRGLADAQAGLVVHYVSGAPGSFILADGATLTPSEAVAGRTVRWQVH